MYKAQSRNWGFYKDKKLSKVLAQWIESKEIVIQHKLG